jgi:hypothetical protein
MKTTFVKLCLTAATLGAALLWAAPSARANVYATDIKLNGSLTSQTVGAASGVPLNITFILNQAATYGTTINILSNGVSVRTLTIASGGQGTLQGLNTVSWDGNNGSGNPIAAGTYSVSITAAAASLGSSWTQFTVNNESNSLNSAYGVAINNNPNSPYYGRVFVGNKSSGTSAAGLPCLNAIMKLNADCSPADEGLFGTAGATLHNDGSCPFGLRYDSANDLLYFLDFELQGDVYACNMILTTNLHVVTAANYASNPHSVVRTGNGFHTFDVVGSGNSGQFFLGDADASGAGVYFWPMANGVASGSSGTQVVGVGSGSSQISIADGGIFVTTSDTVYVGQTIGNNYGDSGTLGVSGANPVVEAFTWNGSTVVTAADIWAADANNSSYEGTWDIGLDNRANPNYVAVPFSQGTSAQGGIQILNAGSGAQVALMDNNREYWGVAFDGVGNVYGCESTAGYIRGYSPPGNSTNTSVAYSTVTITNEPPTITQQPAPATLTTNAGASVSYSVTAAGTPTLTYQWTKNGSSMATQTTSSLALNNLQTTDSGSYAVIVANLYGAVTSSVVNLTVTASPKILQQPLSTWTYTNCSAGFSVLATGSLPLSYQWSRNGAAVSGATLSSLRLSNVQFANAGNYACVVTNLYGSATSAIAVLTVIGTATNDGYAAAILQDGPMAYYRLDETNGTVAHDMVGLYNGIYTNVSLGEPGFSCIDPATAAGFGPGPNSYVGSILGIDGFAAASDTTAFSIEAWVNGPAGQANDSAIVTKGTGDGGEQFDLDLTGGNYRFFVRDSTGAIPPNGTLNGTIGPDGTWQHVVAVYDGSGSGYLYLYVNGQQVGSTAASANGILSTTHEIDIGSRQSGSGAYNDNFNGTIGQVAIYGYALNGSQVYNHYQAQYNWPGFAPVICQEPQPVGPVYPEPSVTATFSVVPAGDPSFTYQWLFDGSPISGANASSYSINGVQPANAGSYSCAVTNNYGGLVSAGALLTVLPTNSYVAAVLGDTPISYWRLDETNGTIAHDYWGGNNGVYNNVNLDQPGYSEADPDPGIGLPANPANRGYVQVANYSPFTFVGAAQFSLEAWVNFTNLTGVQRLFSTMKTGASPNGYGFGINGANELVFTTAGVADNYQPLATGLVVNQWYYLVCTCDGGNYYFYVDGAPVGSQPVTSNTGVQVPLQLGANPSGWPYAEQVLGYLDEMAIYNYALSAAQVADHWGKRPLPVKPIASPVVILPGATNYQSLSATLVENAAGQDLSYQWYKGSTLLYGQTDSTLVLSPLQLADAGSYSVQVWNQAASVTTGAVLTVWPIPTNAAQLNLTNRLVLHLPFDGDYTDISGRLHNGTNVGATAFVTPAAVGNNALSYSSTAGGPYNYVTLGVVPDLQFSSNIDFTVSYWVQLPSGSEFGNLPFFTDAVGSTGNGGFAFAPGVDSSGNPIGGWGWTIGSVTVPGQYNTPNYNTINDGNWHHLVHVAQRNASCTTYLDGAQVDSTAIVEAGDITTANAVTIGQDSTGALSLTAGANLDDLGVWTTILTPLQISGTFLAGATNHVSFAPVVIPAPTPTPVTISNIIGTTLTYGGGSGSQFILMMTNAIVPPGSYAGWAPLATNTATPGTFTIPRTGKAAFFYIQSK